MDSAKGDLTAAADGYYQEGNNVYAIDNEHAIEEVAQATEKEDAVEEGQAALAHEEVYQEGEEARKVQKEASLGKNATDMVQLDEAHFIGDAQVNFRVLLSF